MDSQFKNSISKEPTVSKVSDGNAPEPLKNQTFGSGII